MKNIQLFGGIVLVFAAAMVLFFSLSSVGYSARIAEPVFVLKEGTVLFSLKASMQQNRQLDVQYQHARGLLQQVSGKLRNGMKNTGVGSYFS
jgi:Flp pilus assembly protein TadB